jgi:dienelactone hydrolase
VVLLCGCGGLNAARDAKQMAAWAERMAGWGYVCFQMDSFGPRGFGKGICDRLSALDAHQRLPMQPGPIGWSHGGWTVMRLADAGRRDPAFSPFQVAVAFYPWCEQMRELGAPLLILAGAKDEICPPSRCEALANFAGVKNSPHEFVVKLYPDTYHSFDQEGVEGEMSGKRFGYNRAAAEDAIVQVRDFLARHLKAMGE